MLHETSPPAPASAAGPFLNQTVAGIARQIAALDPGPAAALRRGPLAGAGAVAFWKLMVSVRDAHETANERRWSDVVQAITILTPKGRDPAKLPAHDHQRSMGQALFGAGVSELRLARLLSAPIRARGNAAVRICRRLAAGEQTRFDLRTRARFVLYGDDRTDRRIARDYYNAERAEAKRNLDAGETSSNA